MDKAKTAIKAIENIQYPVLVLFVIAQMVIGKWYLVGQGLYLIGNALQIFRSFALSRPLSEKITNITFFSITLALIIIALI